MCVGVELEEEREKWRGRGGMREKGQRKKTFRCAITSLASLSCFSLPCVLAFYPSTLSHAFATPILVFCPESLSLSIEREKERDARVSSLSFYPGVNYRSVYVMGHEFDESVYQMKAEFVYGDISQWAQT